MADISAELASLPLEYLIAAPMTGAIDSQAAAAGSTVDFIESVGFEEAIGSDQQTPRMVKFGYQENGQSRTISAPLLSIVPIPYIRIKDMNIDFDFKINTVDLAKTSRTSTAKVSASASAKFLFFKAKVKGSYTNTSSRETSSKVDRTAQLKINVNAVQDEMPKGLETILSSLVSSIPTSKSESDASQDEVSGGGSSAGGTTVS